jgi:dienelactone hydrolase
LAIRLALVVVASFGACRDAPRPPAPAVSVSEAAAHDAPIAEPIEEVVRIPLPDHAGMTLEGTVFRPSGRGPFPLVVMNHGAIGKRDPAPRWRPVEQARWFVSRGFVVAIPMRRGNAGSDGDWAEGYGPCAAADYTNADIESASDVRAAVTFMAARPYVDGHHVVLHGMSAGGYAVLALASTSPRWAGVDIVGVMSFAGGRGSLSDDGGMTRHNCAPDALVAAAEGFGRTMSVPSLWLYAANDHFFPPTLARRMFDAFSAHAPDDKTFVALPPFGVEGHAIGWQAAAIPLWESPVARFLERLGLITRR